MSLSKTGFGHCFFFFSISRTKQKKRNNLERGQHTHSWMSKSQRRDLSHQATGTGFPGSVGLDMGGGSWWWRGGVSLMDIQHTHSWLLRLVSRITSSSAQRHITDGTHISRQICPLGVKGTVETNSEWILWRLVSRQFLKKKKKHLSARIMIATSH